MESDTETPQLSDADGMQDLPPSAKLVYFAMREYGVMTQPEIATVTGLPQRTVRYALGRLAGETALVQVRPSLDDCRQKEYRLNKAEVPTYG